jgi:hypothetical protein
MGTRGMHGKGKCMKILVEKLRLGKDWEDTR